MKNKFINKKTGIIFFVLLFVLYVTCLINYKYVATYAKNELFNNISYDVSVDEQNKIIEFLEAGTTVVDFINRIKTGNTNIEFIVYNNAGKKKSDDSLIASGDKVVLKYINGNKIDEYRLSVLGDVNGDGTITTTDVSKLFQYYRGKITMENYYIKAGDVKFNVGNFSLTENELQMVIEDREELDFVIFPSSELEIKLSDIAKLYQKVRNNIDLDYYFSNEGVTWESNNTSVAVVNNGVVESVGAGTAVITVKNAKGISSTCTVNVENVRNAYDYVQTTVLTGANRNITAINVSKTVYNKSDNIVLVGNTDLVDGYLASSLAAALDAPILLVDSNSLDSTVATEIANLKPKKIYIVGGPVIVSSTVESAIKTKVGSNVTIERVYGDNRYTSSVNVADKVNSIKKVDSVLIVDSSNESVDPAMISFVSGRENMPILYSAKDSLYKDISSFLSSRSNIKKVYIVGKDFSDSVVNGIKSLGKTVEILDDTDSATIINRFYSNFDSVVLANSLIDAVTASRLASKTNSVLIYQNSELNELQIQLVAKNSKNIKKVYSLGGTNGKATYRHLMYAINNSNFKSLDDLLFINKKAVFYVPHQDDETLFYSQTITSAIDRLGAENVFVVLVTDGNSSNVKNIAEISSLLTQYGMEFWEARDIEYVAALEELGVTNIQFVDKLDFIKRGRFVDGTLPNNLGGLKQVMKAYDDKYGKDIVHFSFSPYFETHNDHKALGQALTELYLDNSLNYSSFSNVYFMVRSDISVSILDKYSLLLDNNDNSEKILNACEQYKRDLSDPQNIKLGIGYTSVKSMFDGVVANAKNKTMNTKIHIPYYIADSSS